MDINIVSFSGGRTSAYMCHLLKKLDYPNLEFIFMDTGAEHPKTYEFIKNCDKHFNLNLKVLRPAINPEMGKGMTYKIVTPDSLKWDMSIMSDLTKKYGTFSYITPLCTSKLKTDVANKYISQYKDKPLTQWVGIRIDEKRRLKDKKNFKYLAEISSMEKEDIKHWWSKQDFDLEIDEHLGNCVFCVKKGTNRIALAQRDEPQLFDDWVKMIDEARQRNEVPKDIMYRGDTTAKGIVEIFSQHTYEEIKQTMRMYRHQTVCSESCEAFQMELFDGY